MQVVTDSHGGGRAKRKGRDSGMLIATAVMAALALAMLVVAYTRGHGEHIRGLKAGAQMTLQVLPLLIFAFILAGTVQVLVPKETIARWVGTESGLRGILIGTLAGAVTPGGPYVSYPLVAALYRAGAGIGTTVAFVTAWSLVSLARIPTEIPFLGIKIVALRLALSLILPIVLGVLGETIFSKL